MGAGGATMVVTLPSGKGQVTVRCASGRDLRAARHVALRKALPTFVQLTESARTTLMQTALASASVPPRPDPDTLLCRCVLEWTLPGRITAAAITQLDERDKESLAESILSLHGQALKSVAIDLQDDYGNPEWKRVR